MITFQARAQIIYGYYSAQILLLTFFFSDPQLEILLNSSRLFPQKKRMYILSALMTLLSSFNFSQVGDIFKWKDLYVFQLHMSA